MRMHSGSVFVLAVCLVGAGLTGACSNGGGTGFMQGDGGVADVLTGTDAASDHGSAVDVPPISTVPLLLALEPDHGPFNGGTQVTLRGSNLAASLSVTFGGSLVQPANEMLTDSHRLVVLSPSGTPGTVDVAIDDGSHHSNLPASYTYDAWYADPNSGSIAGGTLITLRGQATGWTASTTVTIDSSPCGSVTFVSPEEITCLVPAHTSGAVPITITTGSDSSTVAGAFTYYDGTNLTNGGFGGGHITGNLNVTVLNQLTGGPVPNAYVYVGDDPTVAAPLSGQANTSGQITLASPTLIGPVTVTASAHCFASTTFISEDGVDATIYLIPWLAEVSGVDCGHPPPGNVGGSSIYGAEISGELVWDGPREFGPNPWSNMPEPLDNERRVAFVMTTIDSILGGNPDPGMGGTVLEVIPENYSGRGYAYTIAARPAALAVYAIAGIQTTTTNATRFTPYIMGVARGVLASPRASLTNVDLEMNIPLDHETDVTLMNVPPQDVVGLPNRFQVEGWIDLGGEGVIPRPDVTAHGVLPSDPYRLVAMPAFDGAIADAREIVRTTYGNGTNYSNPSSVVVIGGIVTPDDTVVVDHWVGIPELQSPMAGGTLPANRQISFNVDGSDPNLFWSMIAQAGSSCANGFYLGDVVWWQQYFVGSQHSFGLPDLSLIPGLTDLPRGLYNLSICGIDVAGFDYNNFRYNYLSRFYWTAYSTNTMTVAR